LERNKGGGSRCRLGTAALIAALAGNAGAFGFSAARFTGRLSDPELVLAAPATRGSARAAVADIAGTFSYSTSRRRGSAFVDTGLRFPAPTVDVAGCAVADIARAASEGVGRARSQGFVDAGLSTSASDVAGCADTDVARTACWGAGSLGGYGLTDGSLPFAAPAPDVTGSAVAYVARTIGCGTDLIIATPASNAARATGAHFTSAPSYRGGRLRSDALIGVDLTMRTSAAYTAGATVAYVASTTDGNGSNDGCSHGGGRSRASATHVSRSTGADIARAAGQDGRRFGTGLADI